MGYFIERAKRRTNRRIKKNMYIYLYRLCNHCHFAMNSVTNRENEALTLTKYNNHNNNKNNIKNIKGEKQKKVGFHFFFFWFLVGHSSHSFTRCPYQFIHFIEFHTIHIHISFECLFLKKPAHTHTNRIPTTIHAHSPTPNTASCKWYGLLLWSSILF